MVTTNIQIQTIQTGHVALNVSDLDRSKKFYQELFGYQVMGESQEGDRRYAFLGDGKRLVLALFQQSDCRFGKRQSGLHHLSFQAETMEQVKHTRTSSASLTQNSSMKVLCHTVKGWLRVESGSKIPMASGWRFTAPQGPRIELLQSRTHPLAGSSKSGVFKGVGLPSTFVPCCAMRSRDQEASVQHGKELTQMYLYERRWEHARNLPRW